jgi:lysophospholipase L1-like esterase
VSPRDYEANLRRIVARIRAETEAQVLFATTTPILDKRAAATRAEREYELLDASVQEYNKIASRVMRELQVPVVDLYQTISQAEGKESIDDLIGGDGVHLTRAGQELLGKTVARFVADSLDLAPPSFRAERLDAGD